MAPEIVGERSSYRLSTQDATFIYAESDSGPLHIGSIGFFEGEIGIDGLLRHLEARIHLVPRYRQRLVQVPLNLAHAMMEDDPNFSVEHHVFHHDLAPGLNEAQALDEMMLIYEKPLDREKPLWEMHLYNGLEGGRTAVMWKVHHCLVDGVSGVELLKVMYDFKRDPDPVPPPEEAWVPAPGSKPVERVLDAARDLMRSAMNGLRESTRDLLNDTNSPAKTAKGMAAAAGAIGELASRRLAATPWNAAVVTQSRQIAWTRQSFADFRAIRTAFGGSVNDVVLTILTEGAARYLKHHGYDNHERVLCIGCPVNVRHRDERTALGNRVSMMFPAVPAEPTDVVERLRLINGETERIKESGSAQSLEMMMRVGDAIPPAMIAAASRAATMALDAAAALVRTSGWAPRPGGFGLPAAGINFIATNVPGVMVPQYLCGHLCLDMIPLVPLGATLGYGVAILSYNQYLYFGLMAEPRMMPDVALMRAFVDEAFAELRRRCYEEAGSREARHEQIARVRA
jgi:diacylglycerol O-acyltransferase / wax synthase